MIRRPFTFLIAFLMAFGALAQDEEDDGVLSVASQLIQDAQALYDEGKVQEISSVFQQIMASSPTRSEEVQARRLLTLSYLYLDEPLQSDQGMLDLLKVDPEFILEEEVETSEFINLWYSFRTSPIFAIGIKGNFSLTFANVQEKYSTTSITSDGYSANYGAGIGYGGGLTFEKTFNRWTINPELNLAIRNVRRTENPGIVSPSQYTKIQFQETQTWFEIPLMVQFSIKNTNPLDPRNREGLHPFVYLGFKTSFLLDANLNNNTTRESTGLPDLSNPGTSRTDDNEPMAFGAIAGAGVKYYLYKGFVTADLRFDYGLTNTSKTISGASDPDLVYGIGFANDLIRQNIASFNVGYVKFFYSPKKKKQ